MVEFHRRTMWIVVGGLALVALLSARLSGLAVVWNRTLFELLVFAGAPVSCLLRDRAADRRTRQLIDMLEGLALFGAVSMVAGIGSYVVAARTTGYVDATLAAADRSLRFDWLAWYRLTARRDTFHLLSRIANVRIFSTPTIVLTGLAWSGMQARARAFVAATAIALAVTIAIFAWMPALSAVPYCQGLHPAYIPGADVRHVALTAGLRSGAVTTIDAADMAGLITFPSFHAAAAVLYVRAVWPMRVLRWPVLAIDLAMLVATPLEGSHYLVDVLAGMVVALDAIAAVHGPTMVAAARVRVASAGRWVPAGA